MPLRWARGVEENQKKYKCYKISILETGYGSFFAEMGTKN